MQATSSFKSSELIIFGKTQGKSSSDTLRRWAVEILKGSDNNTAIKSTLSKRYVLASTCPRSIHLKHITSGSWKSDSAFRTYIRIKMIHQNKDSKYKDSCIKIQYYV